MTSRHAELMDAAGYWRQFVVPFYFNDPGDELVGRVLDLMRPTARLKEEWKPYLKIQTRAGKVYTLTAHQARLRFELDKAEPAVGDYIRITYHGEAKRAAPGMNPAKEFTVEVKRPGSQDQGRPETAASGSAVTENAPGPGETPP